MEKRKMTKAEAFEYLKGKKVKCYNLNEMKDIQHFTKSIGYQWGGQIEGVCFVIALCFREDGSLGFYLTEECYNWDKHLEELGVNDILSIEIVEDRFSYDKVVELAKPLMAYLNEVGCQDSIRVSQLDIVHDPMSTLIFNNEYENRL